MIFFGVIELLKAVGMSLKDIQQYMAEKSPENFFRIDASTKGNCCEKSGKNWR
ncbi:hypothetical protein OL548_03170 [Lysinibacillus sp. MHQ-1]|nr:hypothetical protein OL548_03170 [Lysinibacillus sp. MHQ-1]